MLIQPTAVQTPYPATGLYRPEFEHDACGVGFIAHKRGIASHEIITLALESVGCMKHRSGIDADGQSGDGAGLLIQIPHRLLLELLPDLPHAGDYALGMVFLPSPEAEGMALIETVILEQYNVTLRWRDVPVNMETLGPTAHRTCPMIRQFILPRPTNIERGEPFERFLFMARKRIELAAREAHQDELYIASLSARTVVYKGLMLSPYLADFYLDLQNPACETAIALLHTRYSTNTAPVWKRAQPLRLVAHNGEINTVQGNYNWMRARESTLKSSYWTDGLSDVSPIIDPTGSDSAMLDNVLELLTRAGRAIHHGMTMLAPKAWETLPGLNPNVQAFYRYHAALMEPWDGPAGVVFTDGVRVGATLDRIGLRPMRYLETEDLVIANSEAGVATVDEREILRKGKLGPGQMILVDTERGNFLTDSQVKQELSQKAPYQQWVNGFKEFPTETRPAYFSLKPNESDSAASKKVNTTELWLTRLEAAYGYTNEELTVIIKPMAETGKEPTGSMGDDTPLAVMSEKPRPLFHYFKQRFAQVTNPPIDPLRETLVMSLTTRLGARPNLLEATPKHAHLIELTSPVLSDADLTALKGLGDPRFQTKTIDIRYPIEQGEQGLERALNRICRMAEQAIEEGKTILILSDLGINEQYAPIPSLLAVGAVHHHLVRQGKRMQVSIVAESGEVREVHHLACMIGYGANAVNPYLALAAVERLVETRKVKKALREAKRNIIRAMEAGLLKIMSKMGISTADSYCGAQIFEAVGLNNSLIEPYFSGTISRIGGIGLKEIAAEMRRWHKAGYDDPQKPFIDSPGFYKFKRGGELHAYSPKTVKALHKAVRREGALAQAAYEELAYDLEQRETKSFYGDAFSEGYAAYKAFVALLEEGGTLDPRHMLEIIPADERPRAAIDISDVEPIEQIFERFSTGAMSHGALSSEAHETLAIAMNRLGATSNSGEGGSGQHRFGNERNDGIKQIASGRFGVTPAYLMNAHELQIKMAQGAKPGEGGQLPGHKVTAEIATIRHTIEGTTLISPPPHHDIYSIEDLAQLIYDLKQVNPRAAVSVKLVSEAGVGTIAAGVAKGGADVVHIAGHSGGTGAATWSSIKNVGLPWEMGLAETQQALQLNNLRNRIRVRMDGGMQTGRDVIMAAILGADEFSFGTAALVAEGCLMARACHSNTCPVGVATQNPKLRAKFVGTPEHVMAYMHYVAEEVREILAEIGVQTLSEIVGRTELLRQVVTGNPAVDALDLSPLLVKATPIEADPIEPLPLVSSVPVGPLNKMLVEKGQAAIESAEPVDFELQIHPVERTVGATLAGAIAKKYGDVGLPDGTVNVTLRGSAGQSLGAFNVAGINLTLIGEANDYVGKGMGGGQIVVRPPLKFSHESSEHTIIGNTVLYGATGGYLFAAGQAGERFAVRNSGATTVVEGVGDHGCEYMTSGTVIVLGRTGFNFGAGMSGGMAFVLDEGNDLPQRLNPDMVQLARVTNHQDIELLHHFITRHVRLTGSFRGQSILDNWRRQLGLFWKVAPQGTIGSTSVRPEKQLIKTPAGLAATGLSGHVAA